MAANTGLVAVQDEKGGALTVGRTPGDPPPSDAETEWERWGEHGVRGWRWSEEGVRVCPRRIRETGGVDYPGTA